MTKVIMFPIERRRELRLRSTRLSFFERIIGILVCLFCILAAIAAEAQDVNPAPCIGFSCNVETPSMEGLEVLPMPPVINELSCPDEGWFQLGTTCYPFKFVSHREAERHWWHSAWGVFIWGKDIQKRIPGFQMPDTVTAEIFMPVVPFELCNGFDLYPEDNSHLCSKFPDQKTAEAHYQASLETNRQYRALWESFYAQPLPPASKCNLKWGGQGARQNRWKPKSDHRDGPVFVGDIAYCFEDQSITSDMRPININLLDASGNLISRGSFRYCHTANEGRLHHDFPGVRPVGQMILELLFEDGSTECFDIPDASRNYGR